MTTRDSLLVLAIGVAAGPELDKTAMGNLQVLLDVDLELGGAVVLHALVNDFKLFGGLHAFAKEDTLETELLLIRNVRVVKLTINVWVSERKGNPRLSATRSDVPQFLRGRGELITEMNRGEPF